MSLETDKARGTAAQRIIEDPIYKSAWEAVEEAIIGKFRDAANDADSLTRLHLMLQMLYKTRGHLEGCMTTGKIAEHEISTRNKELTD